MSSERALLPFFREFSKQWFRTATAGDVIVLARHINALNKRTGMLSEALEQHGAHFSSYITKTNKRMDGLIKGIKNKKAIEDLHPEIHSVAMDLRNIFLKINDILIHQVEHANHIKHEMEG